MATKTELLDAFEAKAEVLQILDRTVPAVETINNVTIYDIPFLWLVDTDLTNKGIQTISVIDEGQAGEEAYYHSAKRFPDTPQFRQDVDAEIDTLEAGANTIDRIEINSIDNSQEIAKATAYRDDGSTTQHVVYRDTGGSIVSRQLI